MFPLVGSGNGNECDDRNQKEVRIHPKVNDRILGSHTLLNRREEYLIASIIVFQAFHPCRRPHLSQA